MTDNEFEDKCVEIETVWNEGYAAATKSATISILNRMIGLLSLDELKTLRSLVVGRASRTEQTKPRPIKEVSDLLNLGERIKAIKSVRNNLGLGLVDSKQFVDDVAELMGITYCSL